MTVSLTLEPADPSPANPVTITYNVIMNRCKLDTVAITTVISDFGYSIGQGDFDIGPNLENEFTECPLFFKLTQAGYSVG